MVTTKTKPVPTKEAVLSGVQRAVDKVIEQAKLTDQEVVVVRDGKPVRVKARDL